MTDTDTPTLTERQLEVLKLVCLGRTFPEIAAELEMPVRTAKAHTDTLRHKLGVKHKRDLIPAAYRLGLV